jgi:hypothetical protein
MGYGCQPVGCLLQSCIQFAEIFWFKGETLVDSTGILALEPVNKHNSERIDGHGKEMDPHAWHSIPNAKNYANNVRDVLIQVGIRNANFIESVQKLIYQSSINLIGIYGR